MADDPTKLNEFRENNVRLTNENATLKKEIDDLKARFDGIDPAAVAADRAKLTELTDVRTQLSTLETALAAEKAERAKLQTSADALTIDNTIGDVFSKAGGRPEARAFIVAQAVGQFVVKDGKVQGTKFSPDRAGEAMTVAEWVTLQTRQNAFCFLNSSGGGADPKPGGGGTGGAKILKNPTPQQLGQFGREIANGTMKIVYE